MDVASMKGSITLHPVVVYLSHMVLYLSWVVKRDILLTFYLRLNIPTEINLVDIPKFD